jgi:Tol biopolymer transport system component
MAMRRGKSLLVKATMTMTAVLLWVVTACAGSDPLHKVHDVQQKIEDATLTPLQGCPVGEHRDPSKIMDILHEVSSDKRIVFVSGTAILNGALNGVFAIESDGGANIEMYMINPDGTSLTRLTETTAKEYEANRLPDGRRMKIVWDDDGRKIMSISNGIRPNTLEVDTLGRPLLGLCSPDGKKAVFAEQASTSTASPSSGPESDDLYVHSDNGTKKLKDTGTNSNDTNESEPAFTPDSEKLAFISDEDVYVANADGTDQTNLTNDSGGGYYLAWWPDSKKIAFVRGGDIYVINADGTGLTQLTSNAPAPVGDFVISPDGKKIAYLGQFTCGPEDEGQVISNLYVVNADGSDLTNLTGQATCSNVSVDSSQPFLFSPDSKQIAIVLSRSVPRQLVTHDLYVVNVDGTDLTRLTNTDTSEGIITWVWK